MTRPFYSGLVDSCMNNRPLNSRIFDALANPYRRQLLFALFEADPRDDVALDPLELLTQKDTIGNNRATQISMRHTHLPKLDEMGFIEWDQASDECSKGPEWEEITPLLQLMYDHRDELPDEWLSGLSSDE